MDRNMKSILCFTANMGAGGAERQMSILSNLLVEKGYNVKLVTYNDDSEDHYKLNPLIERVRLNAKGNALKREWIVSRFLWKQKPDCIISYRAVQNFVLLLPMCIHKVSKIIASERNLTLSPSSKEKFLYNVLYHKADWIVPNSYSQGKYLTSLGKKWCNRIVPIINYTDKSHFSVADFPDTEVIQIGVFASIHPAKNYERFCEMLSRLKKVTPIKFVVHWYGEKKGGYFNKHSENIHKLITKYSLDDCLRTYPPVKDVSQYMNQFHALCLPSLYEGFSNSLAEYICSGKLVLASDVSDNSLMCRNGVNGFLFDPLDVESMSSAFTKFLCLDRGTMKIFGKNSREIAEELFDEEKFINKYIELIEN